MNTKLLVLGVTFIVCVVNLSIFYIIENWREMRNPRAIPAEPNFRTKVVRYQNEKGEDVLRHSEYTVTTKMADEATLKQLPPPPAGFADPAKTAEPEVPIPTAPAAGQ